MTRDFFLVGPDVEAEREFPADSTLSTKKSLVSYFITASNVVLAELAVRSAAEEARVGECVLEAFDAVAAVLSRQRERADGAAAVGPAGVFVAMSRVGSAKSCQFDVDALDQRLRRAASGRGPFAVHRAIDVVDRIGWRVGGRDCGRLRRILLQWRRPRRLRRRAHRRQRAQDHLASLLPDRLGEPRDGVGVGVGTSSCPSQWSRMEVQLSEPTCLELGVPAVFSWTNVTSISANGPPFGMATPCHSSEVIVNRRLHLGGVREVIHPGSVTAPRWCPGSHSSAGSH